MGRWVRFALFEGMARVGGVWQGLARFGTWGMPTLARVARRRGRSLWGECGHGTRGAEGGGSVLRRRARWRGLARVGRVWHRLARGEVGEELLPLAGGDGGGEAGGGGGRARGERGRHRGLHQTNAVEAHGPP